MISKFQNHIIHFFSHFSLKHEKPIYPNDGSDLVTFTNHGL